MTEGPIWTPAPERVAAANLKRFADRHRPGADMAALWRWSVDRPDDFWRAVWEFCGVIADEPSADGHRAAEGSLPPAGGGQEGGSRWFSGAKLNYAENLLRLRNDLHDRPALIGWNEQGRQGELSFAELGVQVARYQAALSAAGVVPGDRVGGYLPNVPDTVIAALAAASLGAIWTSVSPDFGERAVLDRLGQTRPKVLFAAASTRYAGKTIDLSARLASIVEELSDTERIVLVGEATPAAAQIPRSIGLDAWLDAVDPPPEPTFLRLPFDHPLYVVYSSGTTGLPKGIVHGAGGTLLQHLKELVLHTDLRPEDRIFYFTTCGWMMWNWLISSLAVGAAVVLYDGAPLAPRKDILWEMAEAERITVFGTSARYLALCEKEGVAPRSTRDLSALRTILSTGSPLAPESFDYVYSAVKPDVHLASISGGTDLLSCFALGDPTGPVWRGELQCRGLGMAVEVWSPEGEPLEDSPGELVCTKPFPSLPVEFWNDPSGAKYRAAYFEHFPGREVWRHGDWARLTDHGGGRRGLIISGRSDATLNPGGVRIGTAEIYRQVERLPEILESLAVGQAWQGDVRIVLFVRLAAGVELDETLAERIRQEIRRNASPHHVPKKILAVPDLPRTISGKLSELAVHAAIHGRALGNADALANPTALDFFRNLPELSPVSRAVSALMDGLIDYAGLFPPAGLPMREAVGNYASYRSFSLGARASGPHGSPNIAGRRPAHPGKAEWLGRFVVPARRLGEFGAAFDDLPAEARDGRWSLSVLLGQETPEKDLAIARDFAAGRPEIEIGAFETPADSVETIERLRRLVPAHQEIYFELPIGAPSLDQLLAAVVRNGACAKVRTGGLERKAFPSPDALLAFLTACVEARAPWKATAGLHHALRGDAALTYKPASPSAKMHGFLNVFLAATALWSGRPHDDARALLAGEGRGDLRVHDEAITWRGVRLAAGEIAEARREFCRSIGSCSFTEPVEEIRDIDIPF